MSSSRPLTLLSLGVLIVTAAQGCTFPGANLLQPKTVNYGILKIDPTITTGNYAGKFGAINNLEGSKTDLSKTSIKNIVQIAPDNLFAISTTGSIYNTISGGKSWRQINMPPNALASSLVYSKTNDEKIIISGSTNNVAKIYLSTNQGDLQQVYTDVTGATDVPYLWVSQVDNNKIFAILRNGKNDKAITSTDGGATWQNDVALPAQARMLYEEEGLVKLLLQNNQSLLQINTSGQLPILQLQEAPSEIAKEVLIKQQKNNGSTFYVTEKALYRKSAEGTWNRLTLPITDSPNIDFAINPQNPSEYAISIGKNMLQTTNSGISWNVRNDVGSDEGAGRVLAIHYDKHIKDQMYLGRGK